MPIRMIAEEPLAEEDVLSSSNGKPIMKFTLLEITGTELNIGYVLIGLVISGIILYEITHKKNG